MDNTSTIAAISTALSNSGIGIVRISGEDAFEIANKIFKPFNETQKVTDFKSHTVHYGFVHDGDKTIDECLVLFMRGPHTYTREDVVEIDCHGGVLVVKKILETVLKAGARPAEPGEFTKRAFLNGRIDLSQAEAVMDIINAENSYALDSSVKQLKGAVSESIKEIRAILINRIAYIESALDDPEHYSLEGFPKELAADVKSSKEKISGLLSTADNGRIIKEGIKTVILGKPNVGKSSLLNNLLGEERAIVTDIAGTTRDALEETLKLNDVLLNIIDTAGIRNTDDLVEKIGVEKAKAYADEADLIIFVVDSSKPLDENDADIINIVKDKKVISLLNKSDLESVVNKEDLEKLLDGPVINISALENTGIEELSNEIKKMFYENKISYNNQIYITNARHKALLSDSLESLRLVEKSIEDNMPEDFFSIDLMNAYESLGLIIGEAVEDDLVEEIFSKFCMGK